MKIVSDQQELEHQRTAWTALLADSQANRPTLTPEWLLSWWSVFGQLEGRMLKVGLFFADQRLVGVAPLLARRFWYRPGIPFRRLEFLGSGEPECDEICSDYLSIVAEPGLESRLARVLARSVVCGEWGEWDEIVLSTMDGTSAFPQLLAEQFSERGFETRVWRSNVCPYIPLPASFQDYMNALPGPHRYLVRRSLRDFEAYTAGDHRITRVEKPADLPLGIRILRSLHDERWASEGRSGAFASPYFNRFHEAILPVLLQAGKLDLCWLSVRDEPVAVLYNIVHAGRCYFYQSGRSLLLPKGIRPGIVLHAHAIKQAIARGLSEYDFLAGASRYKRELSLATRPLVTLRATRSSVVEAARRISETGLDRARSWRRNLSSYLQLAG